MSFETASRILIVVAGASLTCWLGVMSVYWIYREWRESDRQLDMGIESRHQDAGPSGTDTPRAEHFPKT